MTTWQDPLHTFDCCWLLGVDVLAADKTYAGNEIFVFRDYLLKRDIYVPVNIYSADIDGYHGSVAIGSYRGGKLVWIEE